MRRLPPLHWLTLAMISCIVVSTARGDWPRFLGKDFDATTQDVGPFDWTADPEVVWSIDLDQGYGIGSVARGRFYQMDAIGRGEGLRERLRAFSTVDGKPIWAEQTPLRYQDMLGYEDGPRSSPTIVGDRIFTMGVAGRLTCRDIHDGKEVWHVDTNARYNVVQNFFGVAASPLVLDDLVLVMVGGSPDGFAPPSPMALDRVEPNGSMLVAFSTIDGSERWRCGNDLASYSSPRPIELGDRTFALVLGRSGLWLIDPVSGGVQWQYDFRAAKLESVNAMVPVVSGDEVFISECYEIGSRLLKVTPSEAKVLWEDPSRDRRRQAFRSHWSTPIKVKGQLFGCSGRNAPDSDLRCIDWATGRVRWVDPRRTRSTLTRVNDKLVVLNERGLLQVVSANPEKFEPVNEWNLAADDERMPGLKYPLWSAPLVSDGLVIVRGDRKVVALRWPQAGRE